LKITSNANCVRGLEGVESVWGGGPGARTERPGYMSKHTTVPIRNRPHVHQGDRRRGQRGEPGDLRWLKRTRIALNGTILVSDLEECGLGTRARRHTCYEMNRSKIYSRARVESNPTSTRSKQYITGVWVGEKRSGLGRACRDEGVIVQANGRGNKTEQG
jgi:hypothetical protein